MKSIQIVSNPVVVATASAGNGVFTRRTAFFTAFAPNLLALLESQPCSATPISHDAQTAQQFETVAKGLSDFALREMHFESRPKVTEWALDRLNAFKDGTLKINGCQSVPEATTFLLSALTKAGEGFNALDALHHYREIGVIDDQEWSASIFNFEERLRQEYYKFRFPAKEYSLQQLELLDATASPLVRYRQELQQVALLPAALAGLVIVGVGISFLVDRVRASRDSGPTN